ncbi:hypothetical protein [Streptomyces sp.]|uniref:hypothetical protein n=1 Tax=Streptomyces sp. TaxID=1931 RepID=UPI002F9270ED
MADHLTELDETLRRILSEPSTAARIALATADVLDEDPHLTVNAWVLGYATTIGARLVTDTLPDVVADEAIRTVARAMPAPYLAETCGEYAIRVRDTARSL